MDIINSVYDSNDYENIHECLTFWDKTANSKINEAVIKMQAKYPKDVLKKFIVSSLNTAENFVFYRNSLATSIAYNSFKQYIFQYGGLKRQHIHPGKT